MFEGTPSVEGKAARLYYQGEKIETPVTSSNDFHGEGESMRRELASRIPPPQKAGMKVLDIGTGFGNNVAFLSKILGDKSKIWTLDPSEDALKNAQEKLSIEGLASHVTFVKGNTEELPFESAFFDLVVSVVVLHHLRSLERALEEMLRVLKGDGGRLILIDWNREAHILPFSSRHDASDFFEPENIVSLLKTADASATMKEFSHWYIIEATK
jgi:ubiquinone/menaquinone biosynthesis C-methylase UbiE